MTDNLAAIKALLAADSTLTATATGGVYVPHDLGRMGLDVSNPQAASAFNSDGTIKPCVVLKFRTNAPVEGMSDDPLQVVAQRQMLECWLYEDNGYSNIGTMMARIFVDLHGKRTGDTLCRWVFEMSPSHDIDLDACMQRMDFACWSIRR